MKLDTLSGDVRKIRSKVDDVKRSLDDFKILVAAKFAQVDDVLGELNVRFGGVESDVREVKTLLQRILTALEEKPAV